jgi:hypothetical protein
VSDTPFNLQDWLGDREEPLDHEEYHVGDVVKIHDRLSTFSRDCAARTRGARGEEATIIAKKSGFYALRLARDEKEILWLPPVDFVVIPSKTMASHSRMRDSERLPR